MPVHVLLVDGNAEERKYYAQGLKACSFDYMIHEAATGQAALDYCHSCSIDCVVLELTLRDRSGFDVLSKLVPNAHLPEVAVVVLTRLDHESLLEVATMNGAQTALMKSRITVELLDKTILNAIATVNRHRAGAKAATPPTDPRRRRAKPA